MKTYDIAIIGAGIVGLATALALSRNTRWKIVVLEAEKDIASHQTGNNSGVIHSGLYYKPGSLKARTCVEGREALYKFCQVNDIPHEACGKLVVATSKEELHHLNLLEQRGLANGLQGIRRLTAEELKEFEPHVNGIAGLHVPQTGIVDYRQVARAYAKIIQETDNEIFLNHRLLGVETKGQLLILKTNQNTIQARAMINCAGLHSDRVARLCGVEPGVRIVPFRGEYYQLKPKKRYLVKNLIYPVPDPAFPFLGVHFTRMIDGSVEAGPNAVLAFKREGYKKLDFSLRDTWETLTWPGFTKLAARYVRMGLGEFYRSFSRSAFVKALQRLIPEITIQDIAPAGAGVRAQALEPDGSLVDDFKIVQTRHMIHVLNAPSPAATASLSIGRQIASMAEKHFSL